MDFDPKFECDPEKDRKNRAKHGGRSLSEGATVFRDRLAIDMPDPDHSLDENRYIIIGMTERNRIGVVGYTDRGDNTRIIWHRKPTQSECKDYENA